MCKSFLTFVVAMSGLALFAAQEEKGKLPTEVFKHWIHSYEEDKDVVQAYRPKGFEFPPSRGRAGFEIKKDGAFIDHPIAPNDGNMTISGHWEPAGEGKIKVTFPKNTDRKSFTLEIVSCKDEVLRVKRSVKK